MERDAGGTWTDERICGRTGRGCRYGGLTDAAHHRHLLVHDRRDCRVGARVNVLATELEVELEEDAAVVAQLWDKSLRG